MFRTYDAQNDEMVLSKRWATAEGLKLFQGTALPGSGVVVDRSELDPSERELSPIGWMPARKT